LLAVLRRERPQRPTLFELFLNGPLYKKLAGTPAPSWPSELTDRLTAIYGFRNAGYDYASFGIPGFGFQAGEVRKEATRSLNDGAVIGDRASFDRYAWPDPAAADYGILDRVAPHLPRGFKLVVLGPGGVLENAIRLVGYEPLCYTIADNPALATDVFESVGSRLVEYYRRVVGHEAVGAIIGNDDWGFKSQTMVSPADMRRFVFPWHKRIVELAHAAGKPAILHSCGCLAWVMEDVIEDMRYDAKHSYEDAIQPVEDAYDQYHKRIAIFGGIDVDFVCRSTPEAVYRRSAAMLRRAERDGGYALGTGNSVPEYIPHDRYFAMIRAALDLRS
jgi:uroporphyrinogen decarboxylase